MDLHDLMRESVDHATRRTPIDTVALAASAQRDGARLRRRRQGLALGGSVAAIAVLTLGVSALPGFGGSEAPEAAYADTSATPAPPVVSPAPTDGTTTDPLVSETPAPPASLVPITGRATTALLRDLALAQRPGAASEYAGQDAGGEPYGEFVLTPEGEGLGVVGINVQPIAILDGEPRDCSPRFMRQCQVTTLDNGDLLRTYAEPGVPTAGGQGQRIVAELLSPERGLRVVASATNGRDLPNNKWDLTRVDPVLDFGQLSAIVLDSQWGLRVDQRYVAEGRDLAPFRDFDAENPVTRKTRK